jgi:hypothetical protein
MKINYAWVGVLGIGEQIISQTEAGIGFSYFFTHAEWSVRLKNVYTCRVCAKKCSTYAKYALKNLLCVLTVW